MKNDEYTITPCPNCGSDDYYFIYYMKDSRKIIGCDKCIASMYWDEYDTEVKMSESD